MVTMTREQEQALEMYRLAHGDGKTLKDLQADPAGVAKWAQWDGNAKKMPGAKKTPATPKAKESTPLTAEKKKLTAEEEKALTQYRTAHGAKSTLADVQADGGVMLWVQWSGDAKKMPRAAAAAADGARINLIDKLDAAAAPAVALTKLTAEQERALAQYRAARGDGKTLADVDADGSVAAWAQWDGNAKKMPGAKPVSKPVAAAAEKKKLTAEEEKALTQYRAAHGAKCTLADVQADGGVVAWAQWSGDAKKMPRAAAAPAKKLPAKEEAVAAKAKPAEAVGGKKTEMSEQDVLGLVVVVGVVGLAFWVYKGLEYVGLVG